ncbi:hypothetical protein CQA38_08450 [Campylobacter sp. MIT 12-5580]|uniref:hypothetical protein n=1 Tax=Campylobacter sp. MIT 12-5580 TaxID=2040651 RepID=UPI0010F7F059|nr:hypothetical protein [Campylobacter sp. MIT 12-5580]TKX28267.1 hypothetical protein CQA38_08450 [Campylobacter sp. MIT 12-5580]
MKKSDWEELKFKAKKVKNLPQFQEAFAKLSGRSRKAKGNIHFATYSRLSKQSKRGGIKRILAHNKREQEVSYLLPQEQREANEYTPFTERQAEALKKRNIEPTQENFFIGYEKEIRNDYEKFHKRKMPKNSQPFVEAVLNLEAHHTIQDIQNALKQSNFPLQAVHIAIHRDEGHKDELTDETIKNYHAHIIFKNYDYNTHRTILRGLDKKEFSQCQQRLIKALGMQINKEQKSTRHLSKWQMIHRKEKQAERLLKEIRQYEKTQEKGVNFNERNLTNTNTAPQVKNGLNQTLDAKAQKIADLRKEVSQSTQNRYKEQTTTKDKDFER